MKPMTALWLGVALLLGLILLRAHDNAVREAASAQRSRDSLVAEVRRTANDARMAHTADSMRAIALIRQRDAALVGQRRLSDSLTLVTRKLIDSLGVVVSDTLQPLMDRLLASWQADQEAWQRERDAADAALSARDSVMGQIESAYVYDLAACRAQTDEALRQLDASLVRTKPGLLTRIRRIAPWALAAYVAGRVLK